MPRLTGIPLSVADLERSVTFYRDVLGCDLLERGGGLGALRLADQQILLLCERGACASLPVGQHDGEGQLHVALAIPADELEAWDSRLAEHAVEIEERRTWERGGHSLYFRDPDRHLLELATPGSGRSTDGQGRLPP